MSLFNTFDNENVKLPTLRQYIKSRIGKSTPKKFLVNTIWVPNAFPSYSIQTEYFRHHVSESEPIGIALKAQLETIVSNNTCIMMMYSTTNERLTTIEFEEGKSKGVWYDLSSQDVVLGYKFR